MKINRLRIQVSVLISLLSVQFAQAGNIVSILSSSKDTFNYSQYYKIATPSSESMNSPVVLNQFDQVGKAFPLPKEKYNRAQHFGTWIKPDPSSCLNTRGLVLKRESKVSTQEIGCYVKDGEWHDPYTDQNFTSSSEIQIDHMVPLKNAYMTGAFEWDNKKRCLYANFLGNNFHLIPVSGSANEVKGDKSPSEYVPPNSAYQCAYIKHWLEIKYIWSLRLTPMEVEGIQKEILQNHCDERDLAIDPKEVAQQRKYIEDHKDLCK